MGAGTSPTVHKFFCVVIHAPFGNFATAGGFSPNLIMKCTSVSRRGIRKYIWKIFTLGVICLQNLKSKVGQNRHLTQSTQQVRDALQRDTVYFMMYSEVQGVSEVGQRFCTTYGCGATGRQSCQIFGFWPTVFSSYKTPKTYLPVTSLQLVGYNAE